MEVQKYKIPLPGSEDAVKFGKDFAVGAFSAAIAKTAIAPVERVKLILQLQTAQVTIAADKRYNGMVDCFVRVPREQGFLSFWRGNLVNIVRACSQESLGMAFKEFFKIWCLNGVNKETQYSRFVTGNLMAGGLSGAATFCFIYPLDFSRTRLAVDMGKDAASREFRGLFDCLYKIAKHDGMLGLYRGFLPSLQYIFLYRSAYYGLFDSLKVLACPKGANDVSFLMAFSIAQVTAFTAAMISYPLDTVRRRLMMQSGKKVRDYTSSWDCAKKIYRFEGSRAFFSGAFVNAIRGVGAALILALYNEISKHI
ncbi:ADP,ATP carrier protein 1 [Aphelenchoides avenae]|nr:ADP,ATP carrier protein 1 [Aphelenchus avenae]